MEESVFVNSPPQNERKLIEVMLKYKEEKGIPIDSSSSSYIMAFYEYTEASSVYLKQNYRNDINGVTYRLHDDQKYAMCSVVVRPSKTESCKWSVYVGIYYNYDRYGNSYSYNETVIDSYATIVDGKLTLSNPL